MGFQAVSMPMPETPPGWDEHKAGGAFFRPVDARRSVVLIQGDDGLWSSFFEMDGMWPRMGAEGKPFEVALCEAEGMHLASCAEHLGDWVGHAGPCWTSSLDGDTDMVVGCARVGTEGGGVELQFGLTTWDRRENTPCLPLDAPERLGGIPLPHRFGYARIQEELKAVLARAEERRPDLERELAGPAPR